MNTPKRGDIALCSRGQLGLITCDEPQRITYNMCRYCFGAIAGGDGECTCEVGTAWVGIHLTESNGHRIGYPWSSRIPRVIGNITDLLGAYYVIGVDLASGPDIAVVRGLPTEDPGRTNSCAPGGIKVFKWQRYAGAKK